MPRREGDPEPSAEASAESSSAPAAPKPKVYELVERVYSRLEELIVKVEANGERIKELEKESFSHKHKMDEFKGAAFVGIEKIGESQQEVVDHLDNVDQELAKSIETFGRLEEFVNDQLSPHCQAFSDLKMQIHQLEARLKQVSGGMKSARSKVKELTRENLKLKEGLIDKKRGLGHEGYLALPQRGLPQEGEDRGLFRGRGGG
jgi:chromosome segregation ATPase